MDSSCDVGDGHQRWFRGMPRPQHLFAPFKEDFYIYVVGCILRYIRVEKTGVNRARVLRTLHHEFDGVSALEANPLREVYAMAEKSINPRVYIYRIDRGKKEPYEPRVVAKLTGIKAMEIRAIRFNKKELVVVLTGYPSFSLSIWKWTTEQELMLALCNEPSEFSDLLISPMNECHWIEYGQQHLTFYDLQSFTKNDVIRTQIYLPQRQISYEVPDPLMGMTFAIKIISACFTHVGDFYVLDDHYGLHVLNQEDKILNWLCSIGFGFIGSNISQIVPYGDCIAATQKDGWMMVYDLPSPMGRMNVIKTFKLTSNIVRYYQLPGSKETFYAMTEKEGLIEGVDEGNPRDPFCIPDLMYSNILGATFIEPRGDYLAVLADSGRVSVMDSETGEMIEQWRLSFKPAGILSHPILPFLFCGTSYGCVNVLDIRSLKKPKLIARVYLTKEPGSCFNKMAFICQGRYLISADTKHDKIFLQYGYPFEEFEYLDSATLPGEIRQINVPGCGKEDFRVQVMVYAKNKVLEVCPSYVYNYSCNNQRLTLTASQSIENPIKAITMAPIKRYLYTYHVEKKKLALTPFCDDNTWTVLQEPEQWIESNFALDLNKMILHGDKLYSFGEDGFIMVHEAPLLPKKRDESMVLKTIIKVQTHLFSDKGILDGIISLDGSQAIVIGCDGTFSRVRLYHKPLEPAWLLLGFEKPKLLECQLASYSIDQEKFKAGKKPPDRIEMIKVKIVEIQLPVESHHSVALPSALTTASEKTTPPSDAQKAGRQFKNKAEGKVRKKKVVEIDLTSQEEEGEGEGEEEYEEEEEEEEATGEEESMAEEEATVSQVEEIETTEEEEEALEKDTLKIEPSVSNVSGKKTRSELRQMLADEAAENREHKNSNVDDITDEEIKILLQPKTEDNDAQLAEPIVIHTGAHAAPAPLEPPSSAKSLKKGKSSRKNKLNKMGSKYKNVKSKVGEYVREHEKPKEKTEEEEGDDDDDSDEILPKNPDGTPAPTPTAPAPVVEGGHLSVAGSQPKKISSATKSKPKAGVSKTKHKPGATKSKTAAEKKHEAKTVAHDAKLKTKGKKSQVSMASSTKQLFKKTVFEDVFDDDLELSILDLSKPHKEIHKNRIYEGSDVDGVFCVSHAIRIGEIPAPEFWAKFENTLIFRQHHPRSVKLLQEFLGMIDLMKSIMVYNNSREPINQVDIKEFNLDDEVEEIMLEKGSKFVQYCHIKMLARNKLRHDRISKYRNMIWEPFEHKGFIFTGFRTQMLISNYPLKPAKMLFGTMVKQCEEERRLELKIENAEPEIVEEGNEFTLNVLKNEVDYVDARSRHFYIKSIKNMDPSMKFDDYHSSGDDGETDDDFLKAVFNEFGLGGQAPPTDDHLKQSQNPNRKPLPEKASRIRKRGKANEKSEVAFGGSLPSKKKSLKLTPSSAPVKTTRSRRRDKEIKNRGESAVRQRLKKRQYRGVEAAGNNDEAKAPDKVTKGKRKGGGVGFKSGESDDDSDESDVSSSVGFSKKDLLAKIKPTKSYISAHGLFGPKSQNRAQGQVETLMAPTSKKKKKKHKSKGVKKAVDGDIEESEDEEDGTGQGRRSRKSDKKARHKDFVIQSEEDLSDGDEDSFTELKNLKYDQMEEHERGPYRNVEEVFYGSIVHELRDMHQYKQNPYRYHQFELYARHHFVRQIWLTMEEIYRIKKFFNKLFDQARNMKSTTLRKMSERNERIREIYYYLRLDLDIIDEKVDPREDPSLVFSVKKSEIPVVKYLTAEQKRLEEIRRQEALARRNTRMAEFRRKALKIMMDSRLEVKREEMLIHDIPKPPFMEEKDPMEFSLEEYLMSLEYQEAVEELEKARVELIKDLEAELYRLYRQNALDYNGTDLRVQEIYLTKIQFHYNVLMEETRLERMVRQIRITDDCQTEEDRINNMLAKLQDGMKSTQALASQLTARRSECKEKTNDLNEKEKDLEKRFRKDIGDVGTYFEFFIKNYKKKPKVPTKGLDKAELFEYGVKALKSPNIRAFARENGDAAKAIVLSIMDIEDPMLMPVGCPRTYWDKFNKLRRERIACEFEMRALNLEMQHITEGLDECKEREEETAQAMAAILAILSHRTDMKNYYIYNSEFQFITGKGSVEIDFWDLKAHDGSVMCLSKHIEKLNSSITAASEIYIQDIRKSMLLHRDVREIEWRFLVVRMAMSDVNQLLLDVNNSKPKKELLRVLRMSINLDTMYEDRMNLVRYLQEASMKFQKIYLKARRRLRKMYIRQTERQDGVNQELKEWLNEHNKTTSLLKHVGIKSSPDVRVKKYNTRVNKFLVRGYMVRKKMMNYDTIDFLEGELARCYKKSFPVL